MQAAPFMASTLHSEVRQPPLEGVCCTLVLRYASAGTVCSAAYTCNKHPDAAPCGQLFVAEVIGSRRKTQKTWILACSVVQLYLFNITASFFFALSVLMILHQIIVFCHCHSRHIRKLTTFTSSASISSTSSTTVCFYSALQMCPI